MADCPALISPVCTIERALPNPITEATGAVGNSALDALAKSIQDAITWVITGTLTSWLQLPSPDLEHEAAIGSLHWWFMPIATVVAVLAIIVAGGKMAITGKANSLTDVAQGLVTIIATGALGVIVPNLLLKASDAWSSWVLTTSADGDFGERLAKTMAIPGAPSGLIIVLGIVGLFMSVVQALLLVFRQASIIILAGMLPLAAAGTLAPKTRAWFTKISGWGLAFIFYKPAAAGIYALSFTMIGKGTDIRTILVGYSIMGLSLIALPALMKLTTWATGSVAQSSGPGGLLSAALSGAVAIGSFRGSNGGAGGASAADQARLMQQRTEQPSSPSSPPTTPGQPTDGSNHNDGSTSVTLAQRPGPTSPPGQQSGDPLGGLAGKPAGAGTAAAGHPSSGSLAGAGAAFGPAGMAATAAAAAVNKGVETAKKGAAAMTEPPDGSQ